MRVSTLALPIALASVAVAAPAKRSLFARNNNAAYSDAEILNYALTLEHLEATFYAEYLNKYGAEAFKDAGFSDWVRYRFTEVANEERTHVNFLTTALKSAGATPVEQCSYNFGVDSVDSFRAFSQLVEGVGVAAYLGAAPSISTKAYLAVAGAILVVEAEHETWVRSAADNEDPYPRPFQAPLDFNQVYTIVAPLITSCPSSNPALPFTTFPSLTVSTAGPYSVGQSISYSTSATGASFAAFITATGSEFVPISGSSGSVTIPEGIVGQSYMVLTNTNSSSMDAATVAGPAVLYVPVKATTFPY